MNHFAVYQKLKQHCKSTILQLKKKITWDFVAYNTKWYSEKYYHLSLGNILNGLLSVGSIQSWDKSCPKKSTLFSQTSNFSLEAFFLCPKSNYIDGVSLSLVFLMSIHAKILIKYRQTAFMLYILTLMGLQSSQSCVLMMRKGWTNRKLTTLLRSIRELKFVENHGPENWTGRQKQRVTA